MAVRGGGVGGGGGSGGSGSGGSRHRFSSLSRQWFLVGVVLLLLLLLLPRPPTAAAAKGHYSCWHAGHQRACWHDGKVAWLTKSRLAKRQDEQRKGFSRLPGAKSFYGYDAQQMCERSHG